MGPSIKIKRSAQPQKTDAEYEEEHQKRIKLADDLIDEVFLRYYSRDYAPLCFQARYVVHHMLMDDMCVWPVPTKGYVRGLIAAFTTMQQQPSFHIHFKMHPKGGWITEDKFCGPVPECPPKCPNPNK